MPLYFLSAVLVITLFEPNLDFLGVRSIQLRISAVLALVLALAHKSIHSMMKRIIKPKSVVAPRWSHVGATVLASVIAGTALLAYSSISG